MSQYKNHQGQPVGFPFDAWKGAALPSAETILGSSCQLEKFNPDKHNMDLFTAFSLDVDDSNWTYLFKGPFDNIDAFEQWSRHTCLNDDPFFYTVVDLNDDKPVGMASFLRINPDNGVIEVGNIHFSPLLQRTRLATEAMYLMMKQVFDVWGYRRYEWKCDSLNAPSCRAAKRLGFQFEGVFRQHMIYKNRNRDTSWFAIIDQDWPSIKAGFECWLASSNFDADGLQLRSLQSCRDQN